MAYDQALADAEYREKNLINTVVAHRQTLREIQDALEGCVGASHIYDRQIERAKELARAQLDTRISIDPRTADGSSTPGDPES